LPVVTLPARALFIDQQSPPYSIAPGLSQRTLPGFSGTGTVAAFRTLDYSVGQGWRGGYELKREVKEAAGETGAGAA